MRIINSMSMGLFCGLASLGLITLLIFLFYLIRADLVIKNKELSDELERSIENLNKK